MRLDGFRLQVLALIVLPLCALLLVLAFAGTRVHARTMRLIVAARDERSARVAAEVVAERILSRRGLLLSIARVLTAGGTLQDALEHLRSSSPARSGFLILDDRGDRVAGAWGAEVSLAEARRIENSPGRALMVGNGTLGQNKLLLSESSGSWTVLGGYEMSELLPSLGSTDETADRDLRVYLVDPDGRFATLIGAEPPEGALSDHPGVRSALQGESGYGYSPTAGGEHVVAFAPVPGSGWALILEEPWENVSSPMLDLSMAAPLALAPALVATLIGLWFSARRVILPLRELERQALLISAGDGRTALPVVRGIGEIRQLQRTLLEMADRLTAANQALRGYIGRITGAQEEERRKIARELHDETVQQLIALDQRLQLLAANREEGGPVDPGRLVELRDAAGKTIRGLRRLSRGLRPDYLEDLGLSAALGVLAGEAEASFGVSTTFDADGTPCRLPADTELAVYRVAQEALSNAGRHSSAKHARVLLSFESGALRLSVQDDGVGFRLPENMEELGKQGHWGLLGMRERAVAVGGRLELDSAVGRGTRVLLSLPTRPTRNPA